MGGASQAGVPGAFWVDFFPILQYVPSWFPGAGFQRKAALWKEATNTMAEKPFYHVQEQSVDVTFFKELMKSSINSLSTENWQSYSVRGSKPY